MKNCTYQFSRKVIMAEEKEREVKNAAKDLVKSQRRAARWNNVFFLLTLSVKIIAGRPRERQRLCTRWV